MVVRYNTLMVITHLVLNDMIKVKGKMYCVLDVHASCVVGMIVQKHQ